MDITKKSTGTLIDEYFTTELKIEFIGRKDEFKHRLELLENSLVLRLEKHKTRKDIAPLTTRLANTLRRCWVAQDNIMEADNHDPYIGQYAKEAQRLNAERNRLIREIDELLGEDEFTQLEKSYA